MLVTVMLKIFQARLQRYLNQELPDIQAGFRKGRGTRHQIANICWIIEKEREFWKNIYFCFMDYARAFDCVDHNNLWKILKEMEIPVHLTCLLRNLYSNQETAIRALRVTADWLTGSKLGKEYDKALYCHPAMQITWCEMLGWMKLKPESRLPGEISTTSHMQMIPLQWHKVKRN